MDIINKNNIGNILIIIAFLAIVAFASYQLGSYHKDTKLADQITVPDTSYSKVKLDSIKLNIGKHDTTIYKLNLKLKEDVERSYNLPDSDAVELFKQLLSGERK